MMKYQELYEEMDRIDAGLSDNIAFLEDEIDEHKRKQLLLEQDLAGLLLLRAEIRQFLKESGVIDDETSDWS